MVDTTNLSEEQAVFAQWVEKNASYLLSIFDFKQRVYVPDRLERFLGVASSGEAIMARFVVGVWRHDNHYEFDYIDAAKTLDYSHMSVITDWLDNPFWP